MGGNFYWRGLGDGLGFPHEQHFTIWVGLERGGPFGVRGAAEGGWASGFLDGGGIADARGDALLGSGMVHGGAAEDGAGL